MDSNHRMQEDSPKLKRGKPIKRANTLPVPSIPPTENDTEITYAGNYDAHSLARTSTSINRKMLIRRRTTHTMKRQTINKPKAHPITERIIANDLEDDNDFHDALEDGWIDEIEPIQPSLTRKHTTIKRKNTLHESFYDAEDNPDVDEKIHVRTRTISKKKTVFKKRRFYEIVASRTGESITVLSKAVQLCSTPVSMYAGAEVGGLLSTGSTIGSTVGDLLVRQFGRKGTKQRVSKVNRISPTNLLVKTARKVGIQATFVKNFKDSLKDSLVEDDDTCAAVVSLLLNSGVVSTELKEKLSSNKNLSTIFEVVEHLSNIGCILPESLRKVSDVAGLVSNFSDIVLHDDDDEIK